MKSIYLGLLLSLSLPTFAGNYYGKILRMEFGPAYGDIVHIWLPKAPDNKAECSTNLNGYYFSFDSSTKIGEKLFSTLLAAQRSDTSVFLVGTGACTTLNKTIEDLSWIQSYR
jgi:hypothetical protein